MRLTVITAFFALIATAHSLNAMGATGSSCKPDTILGNWQRVDGSGEQLDANWHFRPDGLISCTGARCSGAGGLPTSFTMAGTTITLLLERGQLGDLSCKISGSSLAINGGVSRDGLSFERVPDAQ